MLYKEKISSGQNLFPLITHLNFSLKVKKLEIYFQNQEMRFEVIIGMLSFYSNSKGLYNGKVQVFVLLLLYYCGFYYTANSV